MSKQNIGITLNFVNIINYRICYNINKYMDACTKRFGFHIQKFSLALTALFSRLWLWQKKLNNKIVTGWAKLLFFLANNKLFIKHGFVKKFLLFKVPTLPDMVFTAKKTQSVIIVLAIYSFCLHKSISLKKLWAEEEKKECFISILDFSVDRHDLCYQHSMCILSTNLC